MRYNNLIEVMCSERGYSTTSSIGSVYTIKSENNQYSKAFENIEKLKGESNGTNFYYFVKDIPTFDEDFIEFKHLIFERGFKGVLINTPKYLEKISIMLSTPAYSGIARKQIKDVSDIAENIIRNGNFESQDPSRSLIGHLMSQFVTHLSEFDPVVKGPVHSYEHEENSRKDYVDVSSKLDFRLITNYILGFERSNSLSPDSSLLEAYKAYTFEKMKLLPSQAYYSEPKLAKYHDNKRINMISMLKYLDENYHKITVDNYAYYEREVSVNLSQRKKTDKANDFTKNGFSTMLKAFVALKNIDVNIFSLENKFFRKYSEESEYYSTIKQFNETKHLEFPDLEKDPDIIDNTEFIFQYLKDNIKVDLSEVYPAVIKIKPFDQIISEVKIIKEFKKINPAEPTDFEIIADWLNDYKVTTDKYSESYAESVFERNKEVFNTLEGSLDFIKTHRGYVFDYKNEGYPKTFSDKMFNIVSDRANEYSMIQKIESGDSLIDINAYNFVVINPLMLMTAVRKHNINYSKKLNEQLGLGMLKRESPDFSKNIEKAILYMEKTHQGDYTATKAVKIIELLSAIREKYHLVPNTPIGKNLLIAINGDYLSTTYNGSFCLLTETGNLLHIKDGVPNIYSNRVITVEELNEVFY